VIQLAFFPPAPAPVQLSLTFTTTPKGPTMNTTTTTRRRGRLRALLERFRRRDRFGSTHRPFPSSTPEVTPDDWRVIRLALQRAVVEHTTANRWPAAEAAQRTLDKVGNR